MLREASGERQPADSCARLFSTQVFGGFRGSRYGEHVTRDDMLDDVHLLVLSAPPRWLELRPVGDPAQNGELPPPLTLTLTLTLTPTLRPRLTA